MVVWIAYCLSHASAQATHSELEDFAVPLEWNALQHLALDDKSALDASLRVSAYLKRHSSGAPVFSLREDAGTFSIAERHAREHQMFLDIWEVEKVNAASREQSHWVEVQRKKVLAAKLRLEIKQLESELSDASSSYSQARHGSNDEHYWRGRVSDVDSELRGKRLELASAEKAPQAVWQPLPSNEGLALQVLCFQYMPPLFRVLSRLSFTAQQMLIPRPQQEWMEANEVVLATDWTSHYNERQGAGPYTEGVKVRHTGTQGAV